MNTSERGASAVEYGLLIAGIAAVIVSSVLLFGSHLHDLYTDKCSAITEQTSHQPCSETP